MFPKSTLYKTKCAIIMYTYTQYYTKHWVYWSWYKTRNQMCTQCKHTYNPVSTS